jgi:hypothetical protein
MSPRSRYDYRVIGDLLCLVDLDERGSRSVTNDAEQLVPELHALGLLPDGRRLIYRDSTGTWDEMLIAAGGRFAGFRPLRAYSLVEAFAVIRQEGNDAKH